MRFPLGVTGNVPGRSADRSAKALAKPVKLSDGEGLFLLVNPNGSRWWRFRYRYGGKERGISLGVYPDVSLKLARARRNDARRMLVEGVDPGAHRQAGKLARRVTLKLMAERVAGHPGEETRGRHAVQGSLDAYRVHSA